MTKATVGALRVVLGLDSGAFTEGLSAAQKHLRQTSERMQKLGGKIRTVGLAMSGAIVAGATAAGAALGSLTTTITELAAEAQTAGVSFEAFQSLKYVAEKNLVSVEALTDGLKEMQLRADEFAVTGKGSAAEAFERIGLSAAGVKEALKDPALMFEDLIARVGKLDKAAQIRVADELFGGTGGEQFVRLLDQGGEGIRRLKAEFQSSGGLISQESLERAVAFKASMDGLKRAVQGVAVSLLIDSGFAEWLTAAGQKAAQLLAQVNAFAPVLTRVGVGVAAVGVVLGGLAVIAGTVISAIGAILPVLGTVVAFLTGPVGLAIAAAVAGFLLFRKDIIPALHAFAGAVRDTVGPKIQPLFGALKEAVQAIGAVFGAVFGSGSGSTGAELVAWGRRIAQVLGAAVDLLTGAVRVITNVFQALGALLRGDFSAMWSYLWQAVKSAVGAILKAFETLFPGVIGHVRKMVEGVTGWLQGRLFDVLRSVIERVKAVSDAFFRLYDAVVGNSYVPDMVTEIGQWMAQLDDKMVAPALQATQTAAEAFEAMQQRASRAMEALMTDRERLDLGLRRDSRELADLLEAGPSKGGISQAQYDELIKRLRGQHAADRAGLDARGLRMPDIPQVTPVGDMPAVQAFQDTIDRMNEAIHASRERFADAFEYGIESALRGDWRGLLESIFGDVMRNGLREAGRSLFDMLNRSGGEGGGGLWGGVLSAGRALFNKLPGFKTGGSFRVGGAGGVDSSLVAFRATPGEMVDIRRPGQGLGGGGGNTYSFSGNLMTPEFWRQIQSEIAAGEARSNNWAVKNVPGVAQSQSAKQQTYQIGRRKR